MLEGAKQEGTSDVADSRHQTPYSKKTNNGTTDASRGHSPARAMQSADDRCVHKPCQGNRALRRGIRSQPGQTSALTAARASRDTFVIRSSVARIWRHGDLSPNAACAGERWHNRLRPAVMRPRS